MDVSIVGSGYVRTTVAACLADLGHDVVKYRTDPRWLLTWAFWQGFSKRVIGVLVSGTGSQENGPSGLFVLELFPERIENLFFNQNVSDAKQLPFKFLLTGPGSCTSIASPAVGRTIRD